MNIFKSICVLVAFIWSHANCRPNEKKLLESNIKEEGKTQDTLLKEIGNQYDEYNDDDDYYQYEDVPDKDEFMLTNDNEASNVDNSTDVRIVGGKPALPNEFPWMAALVYENSNGKSLIFCGGSLISPNVILTVAHCLQPIDDYKGNIFYRNL